MAARLILSGVGKSGSPAPKSTTSAPSRRNFSASAATFMVEDTLIVEILSAKPCNVCMIFLPSKFSFQLCFHQRRHQAGNIAAQRRHFSDQARTQERIFPSHEERRLQFRPQAPV